MPGSLAGSPLLSVFFQGREVLQFCRALSPLNDSNEYKHKSYDTLDKKETLQVFLKVQTFIL